MNTTSQEHDALLLVSFGGPEGPDDVMPFLENVLRGRNVPRERMLEVSEHYQHFGGVSPINEQNRQLLDAIRKDLKANGVDLPVYWGNRNWHPFLTDEMTKMRDDGIKNALAFFTSTYSCYSGCRQYRENIAQAQEQIGENVPEVHKLRMFYNHPLFIEASVDQVMNAFNQIPEELKAETHFLFSAHSIPNSMADNCKYATQLLETCRLVMEQVGEFNWDLVYQSRSGPPTQPWLEPDVCDFLDTLGGKGTKQVVIMPVGFVSDHMEVLFDLDIEAKEKCEELGIGMQRASSVGTHPKFVEMIRHLILERISGTEKLAIGNYPPNHDVCPVDCCLRATRPNTAAATPTRPS